LNTAHKSTILIVDDDPLTRKLIKTLLSHEEYNLFLAANGAEALAKAAELTPDLILLDVMMPDTDGFEVCRRLRADPLLSTVPVIMITSLNNHAARSKGIQAGADDFVSKPFNHAELKARVRTITRLNRYRLLREQAKFKQLIEHSPDGVAIVTAGGLVGLANPAMLQILNAENETDVIGKDVLAFIASEQVERFFAQLHDVIAEPSRTAKFEAWFTRLNGKQFPVSISIGHFVWNEEPAAQITVRDITSRKRAEDALHQVDRLRMLNDLDQALATSLDPEKVVEITLRQTSAALDAPMGALFILPTKANDPLEQVFVLGQGWIKLETFEQNAQALHAFRQQLEQNDREIIPLSGDKLAALIGQDHTADPWGFNGVAAPIWNDTGLIAALALGGRPVTRPFTDEEQALIEAATNRAGQAIQNAQLYRASQQQSTRLSTLHAISTAAVSSLELDVVLRQVLELARQALNAAAGSILVRDPDTGELIFVLAIPSEKTSLRSQHLSPGQGVAGWVAEHGQAIRVDDVQRDSRWYDGADTITGFDTRSLLCAPMKHHGEITGVIEIVNKRDGSFTDEDLSLLEAVSSITATALENARLYTTTRARAAELARLNEIGLALTSTLDFSTVVHAALSQIQRLFQAEHVSLLQPDPQTGELCFVKALIGRTPVEIPVRLQPGEGIVGWVLEQRQPVLIDDVLTDPRSLEWVYQHIGTHARGLMVVPLLAREHNIGVIEVASSEPGAYTSNELRTLQAITSTLSIAVENASLYDELKTLLREREQAQAQLIHAEKMTALGRLIASIAHEINNPLQAVQTYLTLAQEELDSQQRLDEKTGRYLSTVGDEIERIATIVNRMRDFFRPARQEMQPVYLHATLGSVLELTNKQLQHSNVTVERAWANYLPEIEANSDHLKQVFLNLVLNSIDAMPSGGTLRISTCQQQVRFNQDQDLQAAVRVEFSDTGEGMPPEALSHLFEPFFTTKERGSGLGLSISYAIIQAHHGQITVESHIGLGTTFSILLPIEQP
jgi:PAS domain S-box-containing protein